MTDNGWSEYQKLVLATISENSKRIERTLDAINELKIMHEATKGEISALKIRAGIWGAIAGALPAAVAVLVLLLKG